MSELYWHDVRNNPIPSPLVGDSSYSCRTGEGVTVHTLDLSSMGTTHLVRLSHRESDIFEEEEIILFAEILIDWDDESQDLESEDPESIELLDMEEARHLVDEFIYGRLSGEPVSMHNAMCEWYDRHIASRPRLVAPPSPPSDSWLGDDDLPF